MKKVSKAERQSRLIEMLNDDPFYTDEELSSIFDVSIQTIRLDRLKLGIPELRERIKEMAESQTSKVKTLGVKEITGEIIDLSVGKIGISMLETTNDMTYSKTNIVKDTYIFALTESLAMAVIDAPKVIMRFANIKNLKPVQENDRLIAKAEIYKVKDNKHYVKAIVNSKTHNQIFRGKFIFEEID